MTMKNIPNYHCVSTWVAPNCSKHLQRSESSYFQISFKPFAINPTNQLNIICDFYMQKDELDRECEIKALVDQVHNMKHSLNEKHQHLCNDGSQVHAIDDSEEYPSVITNLTRSMLALKITLM